MGANDIQNMLTIIANGEHLTREQAKRSFQIIMNGGATPGQIAAFLMGLRINGETVDELLGGAEIMRLKALHITAPDGAIDTCGTGGDLKRTLNISTATAIVVASCGVPVAKHGNRGISSASGSADVLQELGVNILGDAKVAEQCLMEAGICFMMAPHYHQTMRHVTPVRVELGLRTVFNLLGPLANPAGVTRQLIGVYDAKWVKPLAEVLKELGAEHAWVVCGEDGSDEIITHGVTHVAELKEGQVRTFDIHPASLGIPMPNSDELRGQDPAFNANAIRRLLTGAPSAFRDIVLLNAAAGLIVAGKEGGLADGMKRAAEAIDSGKARETLARLGWISSQSHEEGSYAT